MLLDQRQMTGPELLSTVEQVEEYWALHAEEKGFRGRLVEGDPSRELRRARERLPAYVSDGRWVADCSRCNNGVAAWRENPVGACLNCGTVFPIEFPADAEEAEAVLDARRPENRHWRPQEQSVADLKVENVTRGLVPAAGREAALERIAELAKVPREHAAATLRAMGLDPARVEIEELG